jgi:hypothetical protein
MIFSQVHWSQLQKESRRCVAPHCYMHIHRASCERWSMVDLDGASVDDVVTRKIKVAARRAKPHMAAALSGTQRREADVAPLR